MERISDEILEAYATQFEKCRDSFDYRDWVTKNRMIPWGMTATLLRELQRLRAQNASSDAATGER